LEVVVRDGSLGTASSLHGIHQGGKENENWKMLRRVLRDPYLERANLKAGRLAMVRGGDAGEIWDLERCEDVTWLLEKHGFDQDETSRKVISPNYGRN